MTNYKLRRDNAPDLKFTGDLLASVKSTPDRAYSNYSGATGRWNELYLYQTKGGKYICANVGRTQWQGEDDQYEVLVCDTENEIREFFGQGWLAKQLYKEAQLDNTEFID